MDIYELESDIKEYRRQILEVLADLEDRGESFNSPVSEPLWDILADMDYTVFRIEAGIRMKRLNKRMICDHRKYPKTHKMLKEILEHNE